LYSGAGKNILFSFLELALRQNFINSGVKTRDGWRGGCGVVGVGSFFHLDAVNSKVIRQFFQGFEIF